MTTLFGIKNCDTIKKAKKWLDTHQVDYQFHDYRVDGISQQWLEHTVSQLGWELILNTRGTTFRQLSAEQKENLDEHKAIALMLEYPAMIKRPILSFQDSWYVGFKDNQYQEIFS